MSASAESSGTINHPAASVAKSADIKAADNTEKNEIKVHAEPQMDVNSLKKLGAGLPDIAVTSLHELGFIQGSIFEGASSEHEFTVFFPVTADSTPASGIIKLRYRTSALTGTMPNLRVEVNDKTVYSTPLALEPTLSGFDIPVSTEDLKIGHVKLTIRASNMPTDVRCFDERTFALHYIQILPETRLELFGLTKPVGSLRGVWSVLPKDVVMSIPQKLTPELMKVILQASTHLRLSGKTVSFVNLPMTGNVIVAERADLSAWLASIPGVSATDFNAESNIAVIQRKGSSDIIALTEAASERDMQLLSRDWRKVTLQGEYLDQTPAGMDKRTNRTFTLGEMGLSEDPHTIIRTTEWKFFAGLPQVPGDMRIKALHINVIAPPTKDRMDERILLFVYVNNILQEVQPVENTGKTQSFTFNIANYSQWVGRNYVKIMAQRFAPRDCLNSLASYQVQITRDSTIEFEKFEVDPRIFNDLHPYFTNGFDLFIDPAYFEVEHLPLLTTVLSDQKYDLANLKVTSYDGKTPFNPVRPFMIYGRQPVSLDDMTVRFDRGSIEVQTDDKRVLLAVKKLPGISIAQVVRHNGVGGLWLAPSEEHIKSDIKEYYLEQGDTSFADPSGEVLNMKTRQMNRAKVGYPEFVDFFGKLGRYRFWIVSVAWMALGLVLVMVYRRIQQNQKKKK
ncbi:MAG: cellulose biosynthesis cyclic di-GMP-binding regulatory protein BcsB [Gallionella sp.]|nr:cellulose biosynthesis cyclic di-GMP-binding regulatory protein BcsB [Gallionella sp.]